LLLILHQPRQPKLILCLLRYAASFLELNVNPCKAILKKRINELGRTRQWFIYAKKTCDLSIYNHTTKGHLNPLNRGASEVCPDFALPPNLATPHKG
jgi:hypothetical protein